MTLHIDPVNPLNQGHVVTMKVMGHFGCMSKYNPGAMVHTLRQRDAMV